MTFVKFMVFVILYVSIGGVFAGLDIIMTPKGDLSDSFIIGMFWPIMLLIWLLIWLLVGFGCLANLVSVGSKYLANFIYARLYRLHRNLRNNNDNYA